MSFILAPFSLELHPSVTMASGEDKYPVNQAVWALDTMSESAKPAVSEEKDTMINRSWQTRTAYFRWFHPNDGTTERRLITKLDLSILTFACIGFWVRAI